MTNTNNNKTQRDPMQLRGNITPLSLQALRYQKGGLGNTYKFEKLLQGIEKMVPQSLKTKLDRHYR